MTWAIEQDRLNAKYGSFCVLSYQAAVGNYAPRGRRRFATIQDALAAASRLDRPGQHFHLVDVAPESRPTP